MDSSADLLDALDGPAPPLENGRERRIELADSLSELLTILNSRRSVDEVLDHLLERVINVLDSGAGAIYLLEQDNGEPFLRVKAARGMDLDVVATRLRVGVPITGLAVSCLRPVAVYDLALALPRSAEDHSEAVVEDRGSHLAVHRTGGRPQQVEVDRVQRLARSHPAMLSVPLVAQDEAHGALTLFYPQPRVFSDQDVELATAFAGQAALAIQNTSLRVGAEQRAQESDRRRAVAEGLGELLQVVNSGSSLSEILDSALAQARNLLRSDAGAVYMLDDPQSGMLTMHASSGRAHAALLRDLPLDSSVTGAAVVHGRAVVCDVLGAFPTQVELVPATLIEDAGTYVRVVRVGGPALRKKDVARMRRLGKHYRTMLSVPLIARDTTYGAIALFYSEPREFANDEVELARTFANQAALAIQNTRLHAQAQRTAALEERQRLARELHDAVTQTLFSAALIAEVLPTVWDANPLKGREHLEELRRLTRGAMAEMRTLLVELRPGALSELGLEALLRQLAEAAMGRTQIDVGVTVVGEPVEGLSPDVKLALYRIAQEALNNVVKHSQAQHVTVLLEYDVAQGTRLLIADDGKGFDPASIPPGHLGINIIAERAAAIGATLTLKSTLGQGTHIQIHTQPPSA